MATTLPMGTGNEPLDREALVAQHLDRVRRIARVVLRDLPSWIPLSDLVSAGNEGLVDAARKYDPKHGASFSTYSHYRIRGAILDHVRKAAGQDPVCRARAMAHSAVDDMIERTASDSPAVSADPVAAGGMLASMLEDMAAAFTLAEIGATVSRPVDEAPDEAAFRAQVREQIGPAVDRLPHKERVMIAAVYCQGLNIEEAGKTLGLTKSWASRLHARALKMLREAMDDGALDSPDDR